MEDDGRIIVSPSRHQSNMKPLGRYGKHRYSSEYMGIPASLIRAGPESTVQYQAHGSGIQAPAFRPVPRIICDLW